MYFAVRESLVFSSFWSFFLRKTTWALSDLGSVSNKIDQNHAYRVRKYIRIQGSKNKKNMKKMKKKNNY